MSSPAQAIQQPSPQFYASIYPGPDSPVPLEFAQIVAELERALGIPIWLLIQNGSGDCASIELDLYKGFQGARGEIAEGQPVGLLVESSGGNAHYAYQIARLFQRRSQSFSVIVPQYAKSAATLIALGSTNLIMGRDAELGPLDVQIFDVEREDISSALNAVQSLERLYAFSLRTIDQTMQLVLYRTGKKSDTLLPHVLSYAANFVRPLLEKIDTVDFTKKSRDLKVAEQYATRLMKPNYPFNVAKRIAGRLVEKFPAHGFVIDRQETEVYEQASPTEAFGLGLKVTKISDEIEALFTKLTPFLDTLTVIGKLKEVRT